jgi:DNA-binding NarL/FixJ family response regulator
MVTAAFLFYNFAVFAAKSIPMPIRVALIDDHYLILESVQHKLATDPEFELVATGTSGEELEPIIAEHHPHVMLLDLGIPAKKGTTLRQGGRFQVLPAIRRMRQKYPETEFLILSGEVDAALVEGALDVEARGYLLKDDELSVDLLHAIRAISRGAVYFSKEIHRQFMTRKGDRPSNMLTERQLEILLAVWRNPNLSYAEHAENLGIAENTFDNHLKAVFRELDANNLAGALVKAVKSGLIPPRLLTQTDDTES